MANQPPPLPRQPPPRLWRQPADNGEVLRLGDPTRPRRRLTLAALLVMVLGLLLGLLSWVTPPPSPYYVPLWITEYRSPVFPAIPGATADRDALKLGAYFQRGSSDAFGSQEQHLLMRELLALRERQPSESVVVYLCAQGGVNDDNTPYILPADADPSDIRTRVPLRQVLDAMIRCPAERKLLILDMQHPWRSQRLGTVDVGLGEGIARVVAEALNQLPTASSLWVLVSCSPGQQALTSPVRGRTVFGHYVEQGLQGWAERYSPKQPVRNDRVSVLELARFVQLRVDRWSRLNATTRQTPVLYGRGEDFDLVAMRRGRPRSHQSIPEPAKYPDWLSAAWKARDAARASRQYRVAPRLYRQLEALLMEAETIWRTEDVRGEAKQAEFQAQLNSLLRRLGQAANAIPFPAVDRSLVLARRRGASSDPAIVEALRKAMANLPGEMPKPDPKAANLPPTRLADQPAIAKATAAILDQFKTASAQDMALAIVDALSELSHPRAVEIVFLHQILLAYRTETRTIEGVMLDELMRLTEQMPGPAWPANAVRTTIQLTLKRSVIETNPEFYRWLWPSIRSAHTLSDEGYSLLLARGYASLDDAEAILQQASRDYEVLGNWTAALEAGLHTRDEASVFAPAFVPYLLHYPNLWPQWQALTAGLSELSSVLQNPSPKDFNETADTLRRLTQVVRTAMTDLQQPFTPPALVTLLARAKRDDAGPNVIDEMDTLLSVPILSLHDRRLLIEAWMELAQKLEAATEQLDQSEDVSGSIGQAAPQSASEPLLREQAQRGLLAVRAELGLMRMAGLDALTGPIKQLVDEQPPDWGKLGAALRQLHTVSIPALLNANQNQLPVLDRLASFLIPNQPYLALDARDLEPRVRLRVADARDLWGQLAQQTRDAQRQVPDNSRASQLLGELARHYQEVGTPRADGFISIVPPAGPIRLTPDDPVARRRFRIEYLGNLQGKPNVRVLLPDDQWLQVTIDDSHLPAADPAIPAQTGQVDLTIRLLPESQRAPDLAMPAGFLLLVELDGRLYCQRVPVELRRASDRLQLRYASTANPKAAMPLPPALDLRPLPTPQPVYFWLHNPAAKAQSALVRLRADDTVLPGGEVKVSVPAGATVPIPFSPGPPLAVPNAKDAPPGQAAPVVPPVPMIPLRRGLSLELLDADNPTITLLTQALPVRVADPRSYLEVSTITFTPVQLPERPSNRLALTVQAVQTDLQPAPLVELVLPPERIPGLLGRKAGTFRGQLAPGQALTLSAEGIQLDPGADERGTIYLKIDESPRALSYRVTFARSGDPTTPTIDENPAVRLRAAPGLVAGLGQSFEVEVDNPPEGATLHVQMERPAADGQPGVVEFRRDFPTARDEYRGVAIRPDGSLLVQVKINDWTVPLDTRQIVGPRLLRAVLRWQADGQPRTLEATQPIILDDTPPTDVGFLDPPKLAQKGSPLTLRATAKDLESGISQVRVVWGKPAADGKLPPDAPSAVGQLQAPGVWTATLDVPADRKGTSEITLIATNGVGLANSKTLTLEVVDQLPPIPAKVSGVVREGGRVQPNLKVELRDAKGTKALQTTTTNEDGRYAFAAVPPGEYRLFCQKSPSLRQADVPIVVQSGKDRVVDLTLLEQ
jgi:hypothetical protein